MLRNPRTFGALVACIALTLIQGCGGFGITDITQPGATPDLGTQVSLRCVGTIGTPFSAVVSDLGASWKVQSAIPLSIVIVRSTTSGGLTPTRVAAVKLASDSSLLSLELINGFTVESLSSTTNPFGLAVGSVKGQLPGFAPPASPDVRFYVKGPSQAIVTALVEDSTTSNALQTRIPALILFENPNGGSQNGRIDGIFSGGGSTVGLLQVDLIINGATVRSGAGISVTLRVG